MSEKRTLFVRLSDMLETISNIRSDLGTMSLEEFVEDGKTQRAVLKSFGDLGEEACQIQNLNPELELNTGLPPNS